ncbi:MAG TPA: tlde1 domain-containing protein [Bradyrhizobium sp.]|nr:tlde1 domain-containing protein [Bradyrhizobium sp.]
MNGGDFSVAVVKQVASSARNVLTAANSSIAVEKPPLAVAPAPVSHGPLLSFADRFAAAAPDSVAPQPVPVSPPKQIAALTPPAERESAAPMPSPRPAEANSDKRSGASVREVAERREHARAREMIASVEKDKPEKPPSIFERLFGKWQSPGSALAYASADASSTSSLGLSRNIGSAGVAPMYDRQTAVYDISAHTVYLPDGTKLEAHSGLGSRLDDPSSANVRMRGVTPPHLYDLTPRESLFHGVAALRLNPVGGESTIYGRSGLLAHTYMLGPNGDSNGCVSFRDYNRFLAAYRSGEIKRLAVVAHL